MKKGIAQIGTSMYLSEQGLFIISHKEPESNVVDVFVITKDEYDKSPNPYEANVVARYEYSSDEISIDDAFEDVMTKYNV